MRKVDTEYAAKWRFQSIPMDEIIKRFSNYSSLIDMALKTEDNLRTHYNVLCSISGGSDSDILIDLIEALDLPVKVTYVFFNTGLEYEATKRHLDTLRAKYDVEIMERRAVMSIPASCKKSGVPFISKMVSENIYRLQRHGFDWVDEPFDTLYARYPKCKTALRWWCNAHEARSHFNISCNSYLKEFMVQNPPAFAISAKCCEGAKKKGVIALEKELQPDLCITGVRKAEGGLRATAYKTCFTLANDGISPNQFRPLFYLTDREKEIYELHRGVTHSDCYTKYGLERTGCVGCPFGRNFERELETAKAYEPGLYRAAMAVFEKSYAYTKAYRAFAEKGRKAKKEAADAQSNGR